MQTILVVDDDPVSVRLLEMTIGRNGYASASASSAAQALAWLETAETVEMVITDQNLGGMSGLELFSAIHRHPRFRRLPVILCTGVADRATIEEAMRLGIRHFIVKPIMPRVVMEKVAAVVAERPRVMESKVSAMARLQLTDAEYKALIHSSQTHIAGLRQELDQAHKNGDRVSTILIAGRLREPASLLDAARLLAAIERLESTGTWHELEQAIALVFEEIADVERALDIEARPQLISRPHGYLGPG